MREILFRGKSVDHNSWEYGYYFISEGRHYIQWAIKNDKMTWCQVHPETVGQFTGLLDKNGKMIFEGDLLKGGVYESYEVKWDSYLCEFNIANHGARYSEIIGNIHYSSDNLPAN